MMLKGTSSFHADHIFAHHIDRFKILVGVVQKLRMSGCFVNHDDQAGQDRIGSNI